MESCKSENDRGFPWIEYGQGTCKNTPSPNHKKQPETKTTQKREQVHIGNTSYDGVLLYMTPAFLYAN